MANWLEKFLAPAPPSQGSRNLPVQTKQNYPVAPSSGDFMGGLPNASVIYGIASSALFVIALSFIVSGRWITGFLVMLPAACFLGYALHFIKHHR